MNRKQLILILVVLAIIGGAGMVLINQHKESWSIHEAKMGDKVLPGFQPNDVAAIHIKGGSELNVVRKNDIWRVQERGDYPASFGQISDLLIRLRDLKVVEAETVDSADLARVNLEEPGNGSGSGVLAEFKDAQGKVLTTLLVGRQYVREKSETSHSPLINDTPDGRYILLPSDPKSVLLISDPLAILTSSPGPWLNRDFFKIEKIKSVSVTPANAANSWKVSRESESSTWVLADIKPDETLDTYLPKSIGNALQFLRFADIVLNPVPSETGLDKPTVVTIETFDHFNYTIKLGSRTPDGDYYMSASVTAEIPAERVAGKDEKPDDKKKLDAEFPGNTKKLQDKLKQEQSLASWVYVLNASTADLLVRDRSRVLKGPDVQKPPSNSMNTGGWQPHVLGQP